VLHWHSDILKQKFLLKLYRPLQNWLINRADVIIGTTPKYLSESPHLKSCNKEKIAVPSGIKPIIPSKTVVKHIRDRYKGKRIVFSLGRLVGYKGFEYLIESAKYLPDEYIIVIGGTGPLKKHLEELIELNDLSSKVKLLGWISDEDLSGYYGACDLYVISSIWKTEAFGLVQIEAMSCGKPIVATKIPESGVDWVNKDGYSGINVETENPKALANAITTILNNEQEYEKFSVNAKKRFNELFTLDKMVNNCLSVYEKIMSC
jgi:rhamnosyl/mannosyltransferase